MDTGLKDKVVFITGASGGIEPPHSGQVVVSLISSSAPSSPHTRT